MISNSDIKLAFIVAVAKNGVIGKDNDLPWHVPGDLKWFKAQTMGKPLIMGRKTFESLDKPLPGRPHIIITSDAAYSYEGVEVVNSIELAIIKAKTLAAKMGVDEVMVVGGATIYKQMLPVADRVYLTQIDLEPDGDAWFDPLGECWKVVWEEPHCDQIPNFLLQTLEKA